jgi:hypothetical protein
MAERADNAVATSETKIHGPLFIYERYGSDDDREAGLREMRFAPPPMLLAAHLIRESAFSEMEGGFT